MKSIVRNTLGLLLAVALAGCGGQTSGPEGMPAGISEIYGAVKKGGRPVQIDPKGQHLVFEPVGGGETLKAPVSEDGGYSVTATRGTQYSVTLLDPDGQPVGEPARVTASEGMTSADIDIAGTPSGD